MRSPHTHKVFGWVVVLNGVLLVWVSAVFGQAPPPQRPAIAEAAGRIDETQNATGVRGPGAVAAHARAGGNNKSEGANRVPGDMVGMNFSDATRIGVAPNDERAIRDGVVVLRIGQGLRQVYPGLGTNPTDEARADIFYRVVTENDKVAAANAAANKTLDMTTGVGRVVVTDGGNTLAFSRAMQKVTPGAVNRVNTAGTAIAEVGPIRAGQGMGRAFAVAVVNDPIEFALEDTSGSGIVDLKIDSGFKLEAPIETSFALALFEVGVREGPDPELEKLVFSLAIGIDFTTAELAGVEVSVLSFDPVLVPDPGAIEAAVRGALHFDAGNHSLMLKDMDNDMMSDPFMLHRVLMAPGSGNVTVRFDYAGLAGVVPEPGTGVVMLAGVGWMLRGRRRCGIKVA